MSVPRAMPSISHELPLPPATVDPLPRRSAAHLISSLSSCKRSVPYSKETDITCLRFKHWRVLSSGTLTSMATGCLCQDRHTASSRPAPWRPPRALWLALRQSDSMTARSRRHPGRTRLPQEAEPSTPLPNQACQRRAEDPGHKTLLSLSTQATTTRDVSGPVAQEGRRRVVAVGTVCTLPSGGNRVVVT